MKNENDLWRALKEFIVLSVFNFTGTQWYGYVISLEVHSRSENRWYDSVVR